VKNFEKKHLYSETPEKLLKIFFKKRTIYYNYKFSALAGGLEPIALLFFFKVFHKYKPNSIGSIPVLFGFIPLKEIIK